MGWYRPPTFNPKAGSLSCAGTIFSILTNALCGHSGEFGIASTGTSSTRPPNWIVLLHRNCTSRMFSHTSTSDLHNCLLPSNGLEPVTTRFDFLEREKKAINKRAHSTASTCLLRSNNPCILVDSCGDKGAACLTRCGFILLSPFNVSLRSMLPAAANGSSNKACSVRIPLM